MATVGLSNANYQKLKELSQELDQPVRTLADYLVSEGLKKVVVKEVKQTTKQLVMDK